MQLTHVFVCLCARCDSLHCLQHEQELSAELSALVNVAYQTLKHPIERIKYLLVREGITVLEEGAPSGDVKLDPMFLMHTMETRERIDEAKGVGELHEIRVENRQLLGELLDRIKDLHEQGDKEGLSAEAVKLQYYSRIDEEADQAITNMCASCSLSQPSERASSEQS